MSEEPYWNPIEFALINDRGQTYEHARDIRIEWRGSGSWSVTESGCCLNDQGKWEYEPHVSSRGNDFTQRTRFPLRKALQMANELLGVQGKHELLVDEQREVQNVTGNKPT